MSRTFSSILLSCLRFLRPRRRWAPLLVCWLGEGYAELSKHGIDGSLEWLAELFP